jgi:DNA-binding NarL/FixJ family response regulator
VNAPIKVLLVDDEGLVRSGFKVLLDLEDDITVVGEATAGAEAVERVRATRPDVVLMDIRMPTLDGIQATTQIAGTRGLEQVRVLILSPPTTPTTTSSRHYRPAPAASTARTHVSHAMAKLGARDRAQLVVIAYQQDWSAQARDLDLVRGHRSTARSRTPGHGI